MCLDARLRIRTEFKYRKYRVMWPFFFLRLIFIKEKKNSLYIVVCNRLK